ncbi:MAG: BrxA/BrxB family bacilliredoxin [Planctomycetes bacterium]|nr:BrxA/BrxB family bacilliredoxin [Planctomycetota bacterium]
MSLSPLYPSEAVQPMRDELTAVGFEELQSPEEVEKVVRETPGVVMCVINSVCGCAAGAARPGVALALQNKVIPDRLVTAFAGMEREAVERIRALHAPTPPSSPSIAFFKDGACMAVMERAHIEGRSPQEIAEDLVRLFDQVCSRPGPSVPPERFAKLSHVKMCGSRIPRVGTP